MNGVAGILVLAIVHGGIAWSEPGAYARGVRPQEYNGHDGSAAPGLVHSSAGLTIPAILEAASGSLTKLKPAPSMRGGKGARIYSQFADSVFLVVTEDGFGSAVVIGRSPIQMVTNWHVVSTATDVALFPRGAEMVSEFAIPGRVVASDKIRDLALIVAPGESIGGALPELASDSDVAIGDDVFAIGHPEGLLWSFSKGVVSQIRPRYEWSYNDTTKHSANVIQTQTSINPGNSGGPLFTGAGRLAGLNTFSRGGEGLHFAVAASEVRTFLKSRPKHTMVEHSVEPTVIEELDRDSNGTVDTLVVDGDGDGVGDYLLLDLDGDGRVDGVGVDSNNNGTIDTIGVDNDGDEIIDEYWIDSDEDGESDTIGVDADGDGEIDRFKPVS